MRLFSKALLFQAFFVPLEVAAQATVSVQLPDVQIFADRLVRGDADTYGLGDWQCAFTATLSGRRLKLDGRISFTEKANDFTTIVGFFHQSILLSELEHYRNAAFSMEPAKGSVSGENIGARGFRWFEGQGIIRRANIQTDTFGSDTGNIGGTVQFAPIKIKVRFLRV